MAQASAQVVQVSSTKAATCMVVFTPANTQQGQVDDEVSHTDVERDSV